MAQVLEMKFNTENGKVFTLSLTDPKPNLTATEISNAMETIIQQDVFHLEGSALTSIKEARITDKTITKMI